LPIDHCGNALEPEQRKQHIWSHLRVMRGHNPLFCAN
jgi:hypothetical protein